MSPIHITALVATPTMASASMHARFYPREGSSNPPLTAGRRPLSVATPAARRLRGVALGGRGRLARQRRRQGWQSDSHSHAPTWTLFEMFRAGDASPLVAGEVVVEGEPARRRRRWSLLDGGARDDDPAVGLQSQTAGRGEISIVIAPEVGERLAILGEGAVELALAGVAQEHEIPAPVLLRGIPEDHCLAMALQRQAAQVDRVADAGTGDAAAPKRAIEGAVWLQ